MSLSWFYTGGILTSADKNQSLGGDQSSVGLVTSPTLNNLFDNVTADEATDGMWDYRCLDLKAYGGQSFFDIELFEQTPMSAITNMKFAFECMIESHMPVAVQSKLGSDTRTIGGGELFTKELLQTTYEGKQLYWMWITANSGLVTGNYVRNANGVYGKIYAVTDTRIIIDSITNPEPVLNVDGIAYNIFADGDMLYKVDSDGTSNPDLTKHCHIINTPFLYAYGFTAFDTATRLFLPKLSNGQAHRIWFEREVPTASTSSSNDGTTVRVEYILGTPAWDSTSSSTT